MRRIFDMENPFWQGLSVIADILADMAEDMEDMSESWDPVEEDMEDMTEGWDPMEEDMEDTEFDEYLDEHYLKEFNGIAVYDYADLFESIQEDPDNPAAPLIRYAVALVRCAMEDVDDLIRMAKGRYADELDIPMSDVEEEYLEEHEEEE